MRRFRLAVVVVSAVMCVQSAFAQLTTRRPPRPDPRSTHELVITPETYGTASQIKLHIAGASLVAHGAGNTKLEDGTGYFYSDSLGTLTAGVNLPSGAKIEGIDLYYDDTDPALDVATFLWAMEGTTTSTLIPIEGASSSGAGGKGIASSIALNHTVNNDNRQYQLYLYGSAADKKVRGVTIKYKLQIKPAPATATFADVPTTHPLFQFIEAMAASGITAGCSASPPQYCPDAPLTRGQMAVFLARGLGLHWIP